MDGYGEVNGFFSCFSTKTPCGSLGFAFLDGLFLRVMNIFVRSLGRFYGKGPTLVTDDVLSAAPEGLSFAHNLVCKWI